MYRFQYESSGTETSDFPLITENVACDTEENESSEAIVHVIAFQMKKMDMSKRKMKIINSLKTIPAILED